MCGRYQFTETEELHEIIQQFDIRQGEIFPTNIVPVLANEPVLMSWGFPHFKNKGVIINARSETVLEKRTFKKPIFESRCVIPSTGFYEWHNKQKHLFTLPNENTLYMAGIYHNNGFIILTTNANDSVKHIHDRMPLVLPKANIHNWIEDTDFALDYLDREPPHLQNIPVEKT